MKKIILSLTVFLFPATVFAATLNVNTVPYVCQGGTNPQLCNSNMTTDNSGNLNVLGQWVSKSSNTVYQAASDGFVLAHGYNLSGTAGLGIMSDGNNPPSTYRAYMQVPSGYDDFVVCPVKKGDNWEVTLYSGTTISWLYFIPIGG